MSDISKLHLLSQQMHLEPSEDAECLQLSSRKKEDVYISQASLPNGKSITLLKTLLTSVCERNCFYCPFRSGRDLRRATFMPEEFAKLFIYMHRIGRVNGLFLSSGVIKNGSYSQDRLIDTAYLLRHKHNYHGYLHLKILPGVDREQLKQAMLLADRISINLEAPNKKRLNMLAPEKDYTHELLAPLQWAQDIRISQYPQLAWKNSWPSTVTQFVVGASGEQDIELLKTSENLMSKMGLSRIYYSGFTPITDTPLENIAPTPLLRQNRLYQASYLMRDYGFSMEELPFMKSGNLPLDVDPKMAWAKINLKDQLVEINTASKHLLLRIPGIGPIGADSILLQRKAKKIVDLSTLHKLGIQTIKAAPYILINGKRPPFQNRLFNL